MNAPRLRKVLDRGGKRSATPLLDGSTRLHRVGRLSSSQSAVAAGALPAQSIILRAAFSLTELLVVIAILTLLAATQLPALSRGKSPVKFTQCMNNCRQIAQATLLYKADNNDTYPYGHRIWMSSVSEPYGWPMELLRYLGGYETNVQPQVYVCPSVTTQPDPSYAFQLHYQSNRQLLRDNVDNDYSTRGSQVRRPAIYWMFMDKDPSGFCNIRSSAFGTLLQVWNYPPGSPEYRRHNGGMCSVAADGHVEWLRTPLYLGNSQPVNPYNFCELGDCAQGWNPASSWARDNPHNGTRVKLWSRYDQKGF
jgi:prepilin-type N-terminal cleavage/methylation domain-containing protein